MKALVTGAAGFIGSHLCDCLLASGHEVIGIDVLTEYYDSALKIRNIEAIVHNGRFRFLQADLLITELDPLLAGSDFIFHLAGQPGVRASWGDDFGVYLDRNVRTTQRLLEVARNHRLRKFVIASSSSVYGNAERYPTHEYDLPQPISPYGVSKLAAERLGLAYWMCFGIPVVALRYFTVYGPRQRPDMAFTKFIAAIAQDQAIPLYGDGKQTRDFTFVDDAVKATIRAATSDVVGEALNVGGGARVTIIEVLEMLSRIIAKPIRIGWQPAPAGDVRDTGADLRRAHEALGYEPVVGLEQGLRAQVTWWMNAARASAIPAQEVTTPRDS